MSQTFYNWQSPITGNVIVEAWGAGGGGHDGGFTGGGGAGGGAYARSTVPVVNLTIYQIAIGDPGIPNQSGDVTYFSNLSNPAAVGGTAGFFNGGGPGGLAVNCVGDVKFDGGNGAYPNSNSGGGGGGSGDDVIAGNPAVGSLGGIALPRGGGGGDGHDISAGDVGKTPGGGGGGGGIVGNGWPGGLGANGALLIWPDNGVWPPPVNTIPYASFGSPPIPPVNQKARKSAFMM
jgi:hypothetical protein